MLYMLYLWERVPGNHRMRLVWCQSQSGHYEEEKNLITAKDGTIIPWQSSYSPVTVTNTQIKSTLLGLSDPQD